ncbi:MAG: hypothetical protein WD894_23335 [Pirellulales bacterium]
MRLYLVRRTPSFIQDNYATLDPQTGRKYLTFADGRRSYFPIRQPKTVKFKIADRDPDDQYAYLYSDAVVNTINHLNLPRYGLGNYVKETPHDPPPSSESKILADLSRAGKRLMGFCRTNLFKRLESSGQAFLLSVERHILRNYIFLHAIENDLPLPIGTQDAGLLDARINDADSDLFDDEGNGNANGESYRLRTENDYRQRAAEIYRVYAGKFQRRFKWLKPSRFLPLLAKDLGADVKALFGILHKCGPWDAARDAKLKALLELVSKRHPDQKLIIVSQFADTVDYLSAQLDRHNVIAAAGVTGQSDDPTAMAMAFQPRKQRKAPHGSTGARAARPDRHRRAQRRPEPARRRHCREL